MLQISRNFPPLVGGMERLNLHMYRELETEFRMALAGPRGCAGVLAPGAEVAEFPAAPAWRFLFGCLVASLRLARRVRPDVVLCGSGTTAPVGWLVSRLWRVPLVVYLHGLDLVARHPVYRALFLPAIRRCDLALVNSRHTARLAREAGLSEERIRVLHPGVDIPERLPDAGQIGAFRDRLGVGDSRLLLSVGRLTRRKGLAEFIERCLPVIVESYPDVLLLIAGGEADQALRPDGGQIGRIRQAAARLGLHDHVRLLGHVPEAELALLFAAADLHVFPVLDVPGDVEGFGMVAIEAAAHGLPTVAFAVGGVVDAVCDPGSGYLVSPSDYGAFVVAIRTCLNSRHPSRADCRVCAESFSCKRFGHALKTVLTGIDVYPA